MFAGNTKVFTTNGLLRSRSVAPAIPNSELDVFGFEADLSIIIVGSTGDEQAYHPTYR
ncbi:MAG: hypothetical protein GDA56_01655 [Hormoscilla sp. GM7CHS1pb]|nr:hypothetical protein [Hormoscilla sp. GM7CHS1pb]